MNIITIIAHTPLWVWALDALLLFLGFQRTRDSTIPFWRMMILPIVVACLAVSTFVGAGLSGLPVMLVGLAIGGTAGWRLEPEDASRRLPEGKIWLRGEWWTFAQIAVVLVFRYAINVLPIIDTALYANPAWYFGTNFISATLSALFLGRTAARLQTYFAPVPAKAG